MKNHKLTLVVLFILMMFFSFNKSSAQGGAAINTTGNPADPSAMLDISSTTKGILIPRMTEAQRLAISSPATGLMVYETDVTPGFWYYNGTSWIQSIGPAGPTGPAGADGATGPTGPTGLLSPGAAAGNTPYWDGNNWVVNSSNIYNNGGSVGIGTSTPNTSAKLDVTSTTQGFLPPRMTEAQRNAIASPATGLLIYQTDQTPGYYYYDGSNWTSIGGGGSATADPTLLYTIDGF